MKTIYKILIVVGVVALLAMIMLIDPVATGVANVTGAAKSKVKSIAQTVVGIAIGVALVTWGIAVLSIPVLATVMIILGLALITYALWPLFAPTQSMG